jgi:DNA polymerase III subunit gamma/tau
MSYVVLARKWRPMSFRDLIGQEHVSRTLANAIARERVAHAFLFTGVRGVGKTTSARILAKALNCLAPQKSESEGVEPCLSCAACREIAEGIDVDVREIDGASYTGVDEIRKLQESLPYRPTRDRYKIFIVDEVHMLSQNAWNALLKTLEEPPPHVKFILATTEVHKVPVTILSRVQRFDFKMIPSRLIAERVRHVLAEEAIEADDRAVALVAREAAGSMRDALSLLDQVIAFSPKQLIGEEVSRVLGIAGYAALADIGEAVLRGDAGRALEGVAALSNQSCDLNVTARDLLGLLRDLVVAKLCQQPDELLDLSDDERRRVKALAGAFDASDLLRVQRGFATSFDDVTRSPEPRAALEMLLARLALRPQLLPIDDLMGRLVELESRLSGGKPPPGSAGGGRPNPGGNPRGGSRPAAPASARAAEAAAPASARAAEAAAPGPSPPPASPPATMPEPPALVAPGLVAPAPAPAPAGPAVFTPAPRPAAAAPAPPPPPAGPAPAPASPAVFTPAPRPAAAAPAPAGPGATAESTDPTDASLTDWRRILDTLGQSRPDLVAILKHTAPLAVSADALTLGYETGNVLEIPMRSPECLAALREAAIGCFGREPKISFQPVTGSLATLADSDKRAREREKRAAVDRAEKHPSVRDAVEILGARVKRIEIGER